MKLPKIPIDYENKEQECFDGSCLLLHVETRLFGVAWWDCEKRRFIEFYSGIEYPSQTVLRPTHYTPMPEFEEVNNDHK